MPVHDCANLVEIVDRWADQTPDREVFAFADEEGPSERTLTFAELQARAWAIAARLAEAARPGDRVLLLFEPGLDFVCGFFACLYAGVVAVPTYPPSGSRLDREVSRLIAIAKDAEVRAVLTSATFAGALDSAALPLTARLLLKAVRWIVAGDADRAPLRFTPRSNDQGLACLQYTSGSTGTPKGVMLTHACLLANLELISRRFGVDSQSTGVIWLPPYHDMGLIGGILQPVYLGARVHLMSPLRFLRSPVEWLRAIARHGASTSGGPNFAYELCARLIPEQALAGLDLSGWKVAFCGAEPVRADTLERFACKFAPTGFRHEAFYPCYGLAEATLLVTGKRALNEAPTAADDPQGPTRISSGTAIGLELAIVDPRTRVTLPDGQEGEIWVSGPSLAAGYWNKPKETRATFGATLDGRPGTYLRTGDLGYLDGGELFVTGRLKDLILLGGRKYHPHDLEATASGAHPAVRSGNVAAFSRSIRGFERLVVVCEIRPGRHDGPAGDLEARISAAILREHGLTPHEVVLVPPGTIPKTTSGKLRRFKVSAMHEKGDLPLFGA